jgi:flagellar biogenesis protein FliO
VHELACYTKHTYANHLELLYDLARVESFRTVHEIPTFSALGKGVSIGSRNSVPIIQVGNMVYIFNK